MRLIVVGLVVLSLLAFVTWYDNSRVKAGRDQERTVCLVEKHTARVFSQEIQAAKIKALQGKIKDMAADKRAWKKKALELQGLLKSTAVTDEELANVESDCDNLGADYSRMYNKIIGDPPII